MNNEKNPAECFKILLRQMLKHYNANTNYPSVIMTFIKNELRPVIDKCKDHAEIRSNAAAYPKGPKGMRGVLEAFADYCEASGLDPESAKNKLSLFCKGIESFESLKNFARVGPDQIRAILVLEDTAMSKAAGAWVKK